MDFTSIAQFVIQQPLRQNLSLGVSERNEVTSCCFCARAGGTAGHGFPETGDCVELFYVVVELGLHFSIEIVGIGGYFCTARALNRGVPLLSPAIGESFAEEHSGIGILCKFN